MSQQPLQRMPDELFRATIDFAILAIKTLVTVNGAAVIALLAFLGQVWAHDQKDGSSLAKVMFAPLLIFLSGLVLALVTTLLAYLTQVVIGELGGGMMVPAAIRLRIAAIIAGIASILAFAIASILTACAIGA